MGGSATSSSTARSLNSGASFGLHHRRTSDGDVAPKCGGPRYKRTLTCDDADVVRTISTNHVQGSTAKYVEGSVGMIRTMKNFATRMIYGQRDGVIVINLDDGGSLSFYKVRFCGLPYSYNGGGMKNMAVMRGRRGGDLLKTSFLRVSWGGEGHFHQHHCHVFRGPPLSEIIRFCFLLKRGGRPFHNTTGLDHLGLDLGCQLLVALAWLGSHLPFDSCEFAFVAICLPSFVVQCRTVSTGQ